MIVVTFKSIMRPLFVSLIFFFSLLSVNAASWERGTVGPDLVKREQRKPLVETEYGEISAAYISDGINGPYHVHFFTLEPDSLFLPVLLHSDMVLYVDSGRGKLSWTDEDKLRTGAIRRGDVFRLEPGSVFYVHSSSESQGDKLRFFAFFSNSEEEPSVGAYSRLSDMITDFDAKVLQSAFKLSPEVAEEIANATDPPAIVSAEAPEEETGLLGEFLVGREPFSDVYSKQKKKYRPFNILETKPDYENCYGWTLNVKDKKLHSLKGSNVGIFVVNMTRGSMMAPHWNPKATEVLVVLQGEGMIRISCSGTAEDSGCKSARFKVREGDVFAVPKFHPMAQMSFNSEQFVLMGFSTTSRDSVAHEFVAGKRSVLQILERSVLAKAFNVPNTTVDQLLAPQQQSVLLDCTSCAEAEEMKMEGREEPQGEREREEEERERERGRRAARIVKLTKLVA